VDRIFFLNFLLYYLAILKKMGETLTFFTTSTGGFAQLNGVAWLGWFFAVIFFIFFGALKKFFDRSF